MHVKEIPIVIGSKNIKQIVKVMKPLICRFSDEDILSTTEKKLPELCKKI